jgi:hypothetical protein
MIITAFPAVILLYSSFKRPESWEYTHKKITYIFSSLLFACTLTLIWGSFIEPRILVVKEYTQDIQQIKKPVRIAFVSDIHMGIYKQTEWMKKIIEKIKTLNPDMVILGGDQIDNDIYNPAELIYLEPLRELAKDYPVYTIHGNHEYGIRGGKSVSDPKYRAADISKEARKRMEDIGVIYLVNQVELVTVEEQTFYLFGGDEYWNHTLDFSTIQNREKKDIPVIGVVHNPSFITETYPYDVPLWLSGHTHGGQIRLPFVGPIGRADSVLSTRYYKGLQELPNTQHILISSGAGETGARARLFNPPEIVFLTIY